MISDMESDEVPAVRQEESEEKIELPNCDSKTLGFVVEYLKRFQELQCGKIQDQEIDIQDRKLLDWESDFCKNDKAMPDLFKILLAANYLDIKPLLDAVCVYIGGHIKDNIENIDEIRKIFGITIPEPSEEEKEEIKKEFADILCEQ